MRHLGLVTSFCATSESTRANSYLSKAFALADLVSQGVNDIHLFTCPGPAVAHESHEHKVLREELPRLNLRVHNYEKKEEIASKYNIPHGDLLDETMAFIRHKSFNNTGFVLEFDGTQNLMTLHDAGVLAETMRVLINLRECGPTVFCLTHSTKRMSRRLAAPLIRTSQPTQYDRLFARPKQASHLPGLPYEGFLLDYLTDHLGTVPTCLWSSRNHWHDLRTHGYRAPGHQTSVYRWVFSLS